MDHNFSAGCELSGPGQLRVKEEPNREAPTSFDLVAQILSATDVKFDHCYCQAIVERKMEPPDWNKLFIKEEPMDEDESFGCDTKLPKAESGLVQVKEEPNQESSCGFGLEDQIPTAVDVWMDHCYTRTIVESENESQDSNSIPVKEEPVDADENECHDGALPMRENAASPSPDNMNFTFAICEPAWVPSIELRIHFEHSYASPAGTGEQPEQGHHSFAETDPLSFDQESDAEDRLENGEEPLEDSQEQLSAIDDGGENQRQAGNVEVRENASCEQHDGSFQVDTDNLPLFQCRLCPLSFESYPAFDCHFLISHSKSSNGCNFSCHLCALTFISCQKLITHLNSHHGCHIKISELFNKSTISIPQGSEEVGPLRCHACLDLFQCATDLKIHLLLNRCELFCVECKSGFISADSLREHRKDCHFKSHRKYRKRRYECALCKGTFFSAGVLLRHLTQRCCEEKFTCQSCKSPFLTADHLAAHTNSFACQLCDERSSDSVSELQASNNAAAEALHCHLCGEVFSRDADLTRHFAISHINFIAEDFLHGYINKTYDREGGSTMDDEVKESQPGETRTGETKHRTDFKVCSRETEQNVPEGNFTCYLCDKTFKSEKILKYHQAAHKSRLDLNCVECERCFTLTSNLKKHLNRCPVPAVQDRMPALKVEKVQPKRPTQPPVSRAKLLNSSAPVKTYVRSVISSCNYTCDLCQKTVSTKRQLREHLKSHVTERNFGCLECKEYFTHAVDFMHHMRCCSEKFVKANKASFKVGPVVKRKVQRKKRRGTKGREKK